MMISLNIQILPFGDNADLIVDGRRYELTPGTVQQPEDLQRLLANEQPWVYAAVLGMLQAAVS